jgi:hypothetical protein
MVAAIAKPLLAPQNLPLGDLGDNPEVEDEDHFPDESNDESDDVFDHLLLAKARRMYKQDNSCPIKPTRPNLHCDMSPRTSWKYTRKSCHMTLDLETGQSMSFDSSPFDG